MKIPLRGAWLIRLLLGLLLLGGVAAAIHRFSRPQPIAVVVAEVGRGRVESSLANTRAGTVEACQRTRLSTIAGGRIDLLAVKEGDRVTQGQVLMRLWNEDQKAQHALAQAQLDTVRRRATEVCTMADASAREAERQAALRQQGFVSIGREDAARTDAQARRASCAAARADVVRVEQDRTVLVAPFAGTVAKIVGEVGEYSTPSPPGVQTPPAIDLIDDSCLYVKAPMDEVDAPRIRPGLPVRISIDALPGKAFDGKVRRVAPYVTAVEKQARTVDIDADFSSADVTAGLRVGYSADVEVILEARDNVLRVPSSALLEGGRVLLLEAGRLSERKVQTGLANWEYTEVVSGLAASERVVTSLERSGVKAGVAAVAETPAAR